MKILEIRLIAFGPFTDMVLDLSRGNDYGLHIVYGPNEAGKSASLRALTALLYGVPVRTADNFIHDNQSLRIGARISNRFGEELVFLRRKGSKDTVLDENGKPIPDSTLNKFLGGVGEDLFHSMFGIDHESLIRGGEQILKGGGAIGESLFAAGMGGTNLHEVRRGLEEEAQKLFLPRGRTQSIANFINAYNEAKQKSVQASLSSREWMEHDTALREAEILKEKITADLRRVDSEKNKLERYRKAIPLIAERQELLSRLQGLGKVKALSPAFGKKRREALQNLERARDVEKDGAETMERLKKKMELLLIPEALLKQADNVVNLHERLGSHRKAFKDLHRLQGEKIQLATDAENLLKELRTDGSLEDVETLRISAAKKARIRDLGNRHQTLMERVARSSRDVKNLEARLASRKEALQNIEPARELGLLRNVVTRAQKQGDLEEDLRKAVAEHGAGRQQFEVELKKLGLWTGAIEELESLPIPASETIDRFENGFNTLERRLQSLLDRIREAEGRRADLDQKINELRLTGQVPTEEDLEQARRRRNHGWSLVRGAWLEGHEDEDELRRFDPQNPLPVAFENSVVESDQIADRLRREADRVAGQATLMAQHKKTLEELEAYGKQDHALRAEIGRLGQEWSDLWKPMGISPLAPSEMKSWLVRHDRLAQLAARLRTEQGRLDGIDRRIQEHRSMLSTCLQNLGEPGVAAEETLEGLIHRGADLISHVDDVVRKRKELHQEIAQLEEDCSMAGRDYEAASAELVGWQTEWSELVRSLGLSETATAAEANTVVDKIENLFGKIDKIAGLNGRISGIERDGSDFEKDVRSLSEMLAPDLLNFPSERVVPELNVRLQKAREDAATRAELREQQKEKERVILEARETMHRSEAQLRELCREAGCSRFEELEEIEERSATAQVIQKDIQGLERQLLGYSGGVTIERLMAEALDLDADSLPVRIDDLADRVEELERGRSELLERIGKEKSLLQLMDGRPEAAEAAEKAQSILARVREETNRYVSLRLASAVLHREIERYRSENQDPLLRRTSEIFAQLTLGSFAALRTDFNESDEPILLGLRPEGDRVTVQGMSDGTRDQLYFALRLASIERYLEHNEPMPLILDDILINFDDKRSEATLRVLEELSGKTQIIFFTHHAHLVELSRQVVADKDLRLHLLSKA